MWVLQKSCCIYRPSTLGRATLSSDPSLFMKTSVAQPDWIGAAVWPPRLMRALLRHSSLSLLSTVVHTTNRKLYSCPHTSLFLFQLMEPHCNPTTALITHWLSQASGDNLCFVPLPQGTLSVLVNGHLLLSCRSLERRGQGPRVCRE